MFTLKRAAAITVGATLAVLAVAACDPQSSTSTSTAHSVGALSTFTAPTSEMAVAPTTEAAPAADPLSSNGTWLVPSDIPAGTYRVTPHGSTGSGYWKLCADLNCEIGTPGFLKNDFITGPGYVVIPATAIAIELDDVTLTRVAG